MPVSIAGGLIGSILLTRTADPADQRVARLSLTRLGARRIEQLSALHLEELRRMAPTFGALWDGLDVDRRE